MKTGQWLAAILCLVLSAGISLQAGADEVDDIQAEISKLQKLLKQTKGQRSELQHQLEKSETDISTIQKEIRAIQHNIKKENNNLEQLHDERSELQQSKVQQQQAVEQQLTQAYQNGRQQKLKLLLNQQDPATIARLMTYYDYLSRANIVQIQQYNQTIARLDQIEPDMLTSRDRLKRDHDKLNLQRQTLKKQQFSRRQTLAQIEKTIKDKDKELQREQIQLEQLLNTMQQSLADMKLPGDYTPFKKQAKSMPWPTKGRLLNGFGGKRNSAGLRWQGVNIAAREGADVQAIHRGRVVFSDWFKGLGMLVIVDHGDGYLSLYAHNQAIFPAPGDWIQRGETIATVGNSGGQKTASLYFEIRHNGKPQNPKKWCK